MCRVGVEGVQYLRHSFIDTKVYCMYPIAYFIQINSSLSGNRVVCIG